MPAFCRDFQGMSTRALRGRCLTFWLPGEALEQADEVALSRRHGQQIHIFTVCPQVSLLSLKKGLLWKCASNQWNRDYLVLSVGYEYRCCAM